MANRVPTFLATAVAAACSLSAHASGPSQADYAKIVLYSNVTIAQDSASQWGIWEELEAPAAGPQTPLPLPAGTAEPYRPLGTVTPSAPNPPVTPPAAVSACSSGALCGFGVMTLSVESWNNTAAQPAELSESNNLRVGFQLFPQTTGEPSWLPEAITISTQPVRTGVTETVPSFSNLGPLVFDGFNVHEHETPRSDLPAGAAGTFERVDIDTDIESLPSGVPAGKFTGNINITKYVSGGVDMPSQSGTAQYGEMYGVWGLTTPAQDMADLRQSNAQAAYSGNTFGADGSRTGSVKMSVNFGASTFVASFNNETDAYGVRVEKTASGGKQLQGPVGFRAEGSITGSTFQATNLSAKDGTVTGVVQGAFFGSQAAAAGGVVDITKSRVNTDPLTKYQDARYSAPFVAVKDAPAR